MNFEAIHAIQNCAELNIYQKACLIIMCTHSKRSHYDSDNDLITNITISNPTLMKKMSCGKTTIYKTLCSLKEGNKDSNEKGRGILINLKENEDGSNNYIMVVSKIKELASHAKTKKVNKPADALEDKKVIHSGSPDELGGSPRELGGSPRELIGSPDGPNHNIHNNIYNNNYHNKKSYFLNKEVKIQSLEHAKTLLSEKLDLIIANNDLAKKYTKWGLMIEVEFHLKDYLENLHKGLYIAIDLIVKAEWDVPTKLKIQRLADAKRADEEQERKAREASVRVSSPILYDKLIKPAETESIFWD